jgi:hypothetical protein
MRRWLKRIVIVLAVFALPSAAFYFYVSWRGDRELRAVLEELDANEAPWRWDDLQEARPPLAAEDDIRPLIVKIASLMPRNFNTRTPNGGAAKPNQLLWPEHVEIHAADLKASEVAVALARTLAGMPRGRLQVRATANLLATSLDEVHKARSVANLLRVSAILDAHHGDLDSAMEKCLALLRLAAALEEFGIIHHLIRCNLQGVAVGTLEHVMAQGQPTPARLEQLQQAWEQFDSSRALTAALRGERAYSHWMFDALATGEISMHNVSGRPKGPPTWEETFHDLRHRFNLKQSHAWTLRHWGVVLKVMELPEPERTARVLELDNEPREAPVAARMLYPALQKVVESHQRTEIRRRCAVVGLACERFRCVHDRWPKTAEELSPKFIARIPDDPHTGEPLRWRATADGIVVYSVGPDGKLSGTYRDEPDQNGLHWSYEFRLWNVSHRRQVDPRQFDARQP